MIIKQENTVLSENADCIQFIKVPLCLQETPYTCGVACVQSILAGYGIIYHQDTLSEMLKQKPIYGTDFRSIINFMEMLGFQVSFHIDMDISMVIELINSGITPILIIQAWKEDEIDYTYDWKNSHYVIACGYDNNRIFFMDPWTLGNYTFISNIELMKRWHTLDQSGMHHYCSGLIIKHDHLPFVYNPCTMKSMD